MAEKPKAISQDTAEAYALLGIPYEGYVEGIGYQSLLAQTLGSCYFQERGCAIPQFEPVMDSSPEMRIQSVGYKHKVKAGETLTSISQYYGATIVSIMAANPSIDWPKDRNNGDLIFAGEVLLLPNLGALEVLPKDPSASTCMFQFAPSNEVRGMMEGGSASRGGKCANCLDPSSIGHNLLGLTYPGGNNPRTYADDYSYSYVPKRLSEYPAIGHDRRYDNLGTAGAKGLLTDTRAIGSDWRFVGEEFGIASNQFVDPVSRMQAGILGFGLGVAALPKTIYQLAKPNGQGLMNIFIWYNYSNVGVTNTPDTHTH